MQGFAEVRTSRPSLLTAISVSSSSLLTRRCCDIVRPASLISRSAALSVEKSQVRPIEESLFRVIESTLEQAQAKRTVSDIGDRHNRNALGRQMTRCTLQHRCRVAQVFEHVEREDDVEGLATKRLERFFGVSRSATMTRSQTCEAASAACSSCSMPHTVQPRFFSARATDPSAAPRSKTRLPGGTDITANE